MSRFRDVFTRRHVVLPVLHVVGAEQAARNVGIAHDAGVDGVFLISHGRVTDDELLRIHHEVASAFPEFWLGVNCLSWTPEDTFARVGDRVAGVWVDDAGIDENREDQPAARRILDAQARAGWKGLYFGGVAFKYQRPVKEHALAARRAAPFMDVVTTSGPGSAQAASPDKVRAMKAGAGQAPLAIASGISPENVGDYLDHADCFLVATGISYTFEELDPGRLLDLVKVVRSYRARVPPHPPG
jgi:hypothetical protein